MLLPVSDLSLALPVATAKLDSPQQTGAYLGEQFMETLVLPNLQGTPVSPPRTESSVAQAFIKTRHFTFACRVPRFFIVARVLLSILIVEFPVCLFFYSRQDPSVNLDCRVP